MGHREDLIEGAKQCLYERGYDHTTARDLVEASGTNLASIGYHFGSKEALLQTALLEASSEWGDEIQRLVSRHPHDQDGSPEFVAQLWSEMLDELERFRPMLAASVEAIAQTVQREELRLAYADAVDEARHSFAEILGDDDTAAGSVLYALTVGLQMQWLIDPERAPTPEAISRGLRQLADSRQPAGDP